MASRCAWRCSPRSSATCRRDGTLNERPMTNTVARPHRGTIFEERAEVLAHERFAGDQFVLTLKAPQCARAATPGSFVHLSCDDQVPMRRPLSIMRAHPDRGTIEVLYKGVGPGLGGPRASP